ncbi:MAG: hypothetical protein R3B47_12520 [Bacteroidia bacterium]
MNSQELQSRINEYKARFREKRRLIYLITGLSLAACLLYAFLGTTRYQAKTVFHPESGSENMLSPLASILGGDMLMINGELKGILASRNLSERVARDSVQINGSRTTIAEVLYARKMKQFSLKSLFSPPDSATFDKKVIKAAKMLRKEMHVLETEYGFLEMIYKDQIPEITQRVCESYIENLEGYYYNQKTEKIRRDLNYYTQQAEIARHKLDSAQAYVAAYQDYQRLGTSASQSLTFLRKQAEANQYNRLYEQWALREAEARAQLQSNTPVVQILDYPDPPFQPVKRSKATLLFSGSFWVGCSLFLSCSEATCWKM